jgi:hypothetical protein
MSEHDDTAVTSDEPVESGALEDADELEAQEGKGYGADEGERDEALSDEAPGDE